MTRMLLIAVAILIFGFLALLGDRELEGGGGRDDCYAMASPSQPTLCK